MGNETGAMGTRKEKLHSHHSHRPTPTFTAFQKFLPWFTLALLGAIALLLLSAALFPSYVFLCPDTLIRLPQHCLRMESDVAHPVWLSGAQEFNCSKAPQSSPVVAQWVEGVKYPFFLSLPTAGTPKHPHPNVVRLLNGRPFKADHISTAVQGVLENLIESKVVRSDSVVLDVGASTGAATFAAAVMGVRVIALEPVFENAQRLCTGVYLNRIPHLVKVHLAAASEVPANMTIHKKVSNLEHSAVEERVTRLATAEEVVSTPVEAITIDSVVGKKVHVAILKVAVQGWELHALKGAKALLSRPPAEAPFLMYEEDRILLRASNATLEDLSEYLRGLGYGRCERAKGYVHCQKSISNSN